MTRLTKKQRLRRLINDSNWPSSLGQELLGAWTLGAGWTDKGEDVYSTDGTIGDLKQEPSSLTDGKKYLLAFKMSVTSVIGGLTVTLGDGNATIFSNTGTKAVEIKAGSGSELKFSVASLNDFIGDIKSIHLREILS